VAMDVKRRLRLGVVASASVLVLSGCGIQVLPVDRHEGPIAIRQTADGLAIVVCRSVEVAHLFASYRDESRDVEWARFLDATGTAKIGAGQTLVGDVPDGLSGYWKEPPGLASSGAINIVTVPPENSGDPEFAAMFAVPDGGLPDEMWLQPDGTLHTEPCE
jgi:hypothetical protein